jgi:phosphate transport system protein
MLSAFEEELEKLKKNISGMANLVDSQIEYANKALHDLDPGLCKVVKSRDSEIDAYDNLIQAESENLLALFQPVALDLRYVIATMMINSQLERCGDIAVNIVQRVKKVLDYPALMKELPISDMCDAACNMAHDAINAYLTKDVKLAESILPQDDVVDDYNKQLFHELTEKMKNDPSLIEPCSQLIVLTRHLERLGDHATNIAEEIIFWVNSEIVSHNANQPK